MLSDFKLEAHKSNFALYEKGFVDLRILVSSEGTEKLRRSAADLIVYEVSSVLRGASSF
jgi:hypothetical protein